MNVLKCIRILALAAVAPFAIAASAADAAVYEVVDRFDPFKLDEDENVIFDSDGKPVPGDPLKKGFSVTGTIEPVNPDNSPEASSWLAVVA